MALECDYARALFVEARSLLAILPATSDRANAVRTGVPEDRYVRLEREHRVTTRERASRYGDHDARL